MVILVSDNDHVPQEQKTIWLAAAQWRASHTTIEHIYQSQCRGILGNETFDTVTCCSKLVCKLIGDTVNKNEEHIWKYVNGKRFLHRLEQVERGAATSGKTEKIQVTNKHRRVKEETDSNDSEFWMLKSSSGSESEQESDEENCKGSHCDAKEYEELSERTKRMSIEIGPSMIITAAPL
ncbi:hypothetical protein F2Q68_00017902 [Brassica cretica]|uniref:Uncharacterized protein n=1 Tax=Brassica cretica TaxID=69181 RepID=A0A8S9HFV2_BRACR|nr:hypothetical protein F2Q68_00017902 [Brassica cretica]